VTVNDLQGPEGIFGSVQVTSSLGSLLVPASGMPVCVVNNDPVNSIYLGDSPSITPGQQNTTTVLGPLNVCTFDGTLPVYGICATGITVQALLFPTGSDWSPSPIQIQEQLADLGLATLVEQINQNSAIPTNISTTGAPLLNLYNKIVSQVSTPIGIGGELSLPSSGGSYPIGQIGYEFLIEASTAQNTAVAPVSVIFTWTDSSTGFITAIQVYNFYSAYTGAGGGAHVVEGHGPSNGDQLNVSIFASTSAITVSFTLLQTSRIYGRHEWRTQNAAGNITFPTMTYVSCAPAVNILAAASISLAQNATETYLLPFYTGACMLSGTTTNAIDGVWQIRDTLTNLSFPVLTQLSGANTGPVPITLPRDQCQLELENTDAAAQFVNVAITIQELETN
jgi:hypothetical protein